MKKLTKEEMKEVRGGYHCKYCNYTNIMSWEGMRNHAFAWHQVKLGKDPYDHRDWW